MATVSGTSCRLGTRQLLQRLQRHLRLAKTETCYDGRNTQVLLHGVDRLATTLAKVAVLPYDHSLAWNANGNSSGVHPVLTVDSPGDCCKQSLRGARGCVVVSLSDVRNHRDPFGDYTAVHQLGCENSTCCEQSAWRRASPVCARAKLWYCARRDFH